MKMHIPYQLWFNVGTSSSLISTWNKYTYKNSHHYYANIINMTKQSILYLHTVTNCLPPSTRDPYNPRKNVICSKNHFYVNFYHVAIILKISTPTIFPRIFPSTISKKITHTFFHPRNF